MGERGITWSSMGKTTEKGPYSNLTWKTNLNHGTSWLVAFDPVASRPPSSLSFSRFSRFDFAFEKNWKRHQSTAFFKPSRLLSLPIGSERAKEMCPDRDSVLRFCARQCPQPTNDKPNWKRQSTSLPVCLHWPNYGLKSFPSFHSLSLSLSLSHTYFFY